MAGLPAKTWRMAKLLLPNKNHLSPGASRNYESDVADGSTHEPRVGATQRRSTKSGRCSLSRLVTLRAASHGPLARPIETGELVDQRRPGREVALC
jgi:hypothetical protein